MLQFYVFYILKVMDYNFAWKYVLLDFHLVIHFVDTCC